MSMLVEIKNVSKSFLKEKALDDISLNIKRGEKIAMLGPNGAGKTTLIRAILSFYHIENGTIRVDGIDLAKNRIKALEKISFIPQTSPPIKLSVSELVSFVARSSAIPKEIIFENADKMNLDLKHNLKKQFFKLSGGMKQQLLIAIALSKKSSLLIFDEPTANLDTKARDSFYSLLQGLDDNYAILIATHRLYEIKGLINRKILMDLGKVIEDESI